MLPHFNCPPTLDTTGFLGYNTDINRSVYRGGNAFGSTDAERPLNFTCVGAFLCLILP